MSINGFSDFPVGARVKIKRGVVDFHVFAGNDHGAVIKNDGEYLGVIVKFDKSRWIDAGGRIWEMTEFGFNPEHLETSDAKHCSDCGGVLGGERPQDTDLTITALYNHPSKRSMPGELLCDWCFDIWLAYRQIGAHTLVEPAYTLQDVTDAEGTNV